MSGILLYTIGHSTKTARDFNLSLLAHDIEGVVDIRSRPYSSFNPQFNKGELKKSLAGARIAYKWVGWGLGGLDTTEPARKEEGIVELQRLLATGKTVTLMCSEGKPNICHRQALAEELIERGVCERVVHILPDGRTTGAVCQPSLFG